MIIAERESPVVCDTCGEPAVRRTLTVRFAGKGGADVSYDTHARSLTDNEHQAAIQRMEGFFAGVFALRGELKALLQDLEYGAIVEFDLDTVHPDACSRRSEVKVSAAVRAFGLTETVTGPSLALDGLTAESAAASVRLLAADVARRLKDRFDAGQF